MTLGYSSRRRYMTLAIVAILSLELVLIQEHMKPVNALITNKAEAIAIKSILSFLYLLKSKSMAYFVATISHVYCFGFLIIAFCLIPVHCLCLLISTDALPL